MTDLELIAEQAKEIVQLKLQLKSTQEMKEKYAKWWLETKKELDGKTIDADNG